MYSADGKARSLEAGGSLMEKKYSIIWRIFMDFPTWGSSKLSQVIPIQSSLTGNFDATWSWSSKVQPATAWVQLSNGP